MPRTLSSCSSEARSQGETLKTFSVKLPAAVIRRMRVHALMTRKPLCDVVRELMNEHLPEYAPATE